MYQSNFIILKELINELNKPIPTGDACMTMILNTVGITQFQYQTQFFMTKTVIACSKNYAF